jgi:hypothetical protein
MGQGRVSRFGLNALPVKTRGATFGPFWARGWKQVVETMEKAASNYKDGDATGFENVAKCVTSDLAYLEVERLRSKVGGRSDVRLWRCGRRASFGRKMVSGRLCIVMPIR